MNTAAQLAATAAEKSWLDLEPVTHLIEDQVQSLVCEMTGSTVLKMVRDTYQGLPVWVPQTGDPGEVLISAPGEGRDATVSVSSKLAGLAITAHAAEYLYYGSDKRFPMAATVKRYKYRLQELATILAQEQLTSDAAEDFNLLLGLDW